MGPRALPRCGDPTDALLHRGGPVLAGAFPPVVGGGGDGAFAGEVTLTAGDEPVAGVAAPEAGVYVAHEGIVVATPLPQDLPAVAVELAPGATVVFPARGSLRPCSPGAGPATLTPGRYEVFAVVTVTDGAGQPAVVTGGPWPVDVSPA